MRESADMVIADILQPFLYLRLILSAISQKDTGLMHLYGIVPQINI
jgi:hypothetical protein